MSNIENLTRWGAKWAFDEPEPAELNPVLLLWWMRDRVNYEQLIYLGWIITIASRCA